MLKIGAWLFEPSTRRILRGHDERKLSPKAACVLLALAETPGQVWSRDALLERAWPGVTVGEEVLTHAVAELRRAFDDDARAPRTVETIHKAGYRLLVPATQIAPDADVAIGASDGEDPAALRHRLSRAFDIDAYAAYLNAVAHWEREDALSAAALFASALAKHPDFALAHAGLAKALASIATYDEPRTARRARLLDEAMEHCRAAKMGAFGVPDAYAAEGYVTAMAGDFARAKVQLGIAVRLAPLEADTHRSLGRVCFASGAASTAAVMFERAAALCADDFRSLILAATARRRAGDERSARADVERALMRLETGPAHDPADERCLCCKVQCLFQLGRGDEAAALMTRMPHGREACFHLAGGYARSGERRRALDELEEAVERGWRHKAWLDHDPNFDALRSDRRFKRIANTMQAAA